MFEILDRSKESLHLLLRENGWKPPSTLPLGNSEPFPIPLERRLIKKLQCPIGLSDCSLRNLSLLDEIMKVLSDLRVSQFRRGSMKVKGEPPDTGQISAPCVRTKIPQLQIPLHLIVQSSHDRSPFLKVDLVTSTFYQKGDQTGTTGPMKKRQGISEQRSFARTYSVIKELTV
jgi:hypothetical protein